MNEVIEEPKTLMYGLGSVINHNSPIDKELKNQLFTLKIDDGSWMTNTNALQKNSEFLQGGHLQMMSAL